MALPTKKPALAVKIGIGAPKGEDLGAPESLDKPSMLAHEDAESPEEEESEESGADLLTSMTKPLVDAGLSDDDARSMLADVLDAACKALRGGKESAEPAAEEAMEPEGGESPYGR